MDGSSLQILALLLSVFSLLALGTPESVIVLLQRLAFLVSSGISLYASICYDSSFQLNARKIPGIWRLVFTLLCLLSLVFLGSPNSMIRLSQRLLTLLLSGIGGVEFWYFELPNDFRPRRNPGFSVPGVRVLSTEEREVYDTICDQRDTILCLKSTVSQLEKDFAREKQISDGQDKALQKDFDRIKALERELAQLKQHRCAFPAFQSLISKPKLVCLPGPSKKELSAKMSSLKSALANSLRTNEILRAEVARFERIHGEKLAVLEEQRFKEMGERFFGPCYRVNRSHPTQFEALRNIPDHSRYTPHESALAPHNSADCSRTTPPSLPGTVDNPSQPQKMQSVPAGPVNPAPPALPAPSLAGDPVAPAANPALQDKPAAEMTREETDQWLLDNAGEEEEASQPGKHTADLASLGPGLFAPVTINFVCKSEDNLSTENIVLAADKTFGDLERAWLALKGTSVGEKRVEWMEYGDSQIDLPRSALISSIALIMREGFAEVHLSLK